MRTIKWYESQSKLWILIRSKHRGINLIFASAEALREGGLKPLIVLIVLLLAVVPTNAQKLIPELKCFEQIVNQNWIGRFDDPSETAENQLTIESILNGVAVMETHCVPAAEDFCSQTIYYWDPEVKTIAATRITNNRWLFRFTVTPKDSVILFEGTSYSPEGKISKVKSERVIQKNGGIKDNKGQLDSRTYKRK